MSTRQWVLGVEACPGGWAGIAWSGDDVVGLFSPTIVGLAQEAVERLGVEVMAIDMPIGLPDEGPRQADVLARRVLGRRRSSVFLTPIRAALLAPTYAEALEVSRAVTGAGLSRQAYALRVKALEVDEYVRPPQLRVVETHPEVSFMEMNGGPVDWSKKTWTGFEQRRRLLADQGLVIPDDLGELGQRAHADDVLDAAAAAWTARRVLLGTARSLPDPPEVFSNGRPVAIWY